MKGINFTAIDFETATYNRASICEAGICTVRNGEITETRSWLVRPEGNYYNYRNIQIHGISPKDTAHSPEFPEIWEEISSYVNECPVLVAHNAAFDISCLRNSFELYGIEKPDIKYFCSLRGAKHLYDFKCNTLDYLCNIFDIPCNNYHRAGNDAEMCARLFLREIKDAVRYGIEEMDFCSGIL